MTPRIKTPTEARQLDIIEPQAGEPKGQPPMFRIGRRTLWALAVLSAVLWIAHVLWHDGYFLRLSFEFDRASYARVRKVIEADPGRDGGQPFDDVSQALDLDSVPWDDESFQAEPGTYRVYHFPGFGLHVDTAHLPVGVTPATRFNSGASRDGPQRLWLLSGSIRVDGLDRKARMRRYAKEVEEECDRINAEMDRKRRSRTNSESQEP